jgi:hypothetical protein
LGDLLAAHFFAASNGGCKAMASTNGAASSDRLDNFPIARTNIVEEAQEALSKVYARPTLKSTVDDGKFQAVLNNCLLHRFGLSYSRYGSAVEWGFPATDWFLQMFPIKGSADVAVGRQKMTMTSGDSAVISPGMAFDLACGAGYDRLALQIDAKTLTDKLVALTGATINEPLRLDLQQDFTQPVAQMWRSYVLFLVNEVEMAGPPLPALMLAQYEQLVTTLFLYGNRHNYSHLLKMDAPDAAAWQVRRAEEYVDASLQQQQPVTVEDVAEVAGVSARSLLRTHKKRRGYSLLRFSGLVRGKRRDMH